MVKLGDSIWMVLVNDAIRGQEVLSVHATDECAYERGARAIQENVFLTQANKTEFTKLYDASQFRKAVMFVSRLGGNDKTVSVVEHTLMR